MRQEPMLAGVIAGTRGEEHWDIETNTVDFFDLKGDLEAILELSANEKHTRLQQRSIQHFTQANLRQSS